MGRSMLYSIGVPSILADMNVRSHSTPSPWAADTESDPCRINLSVASNGEFGEGAFVSLPRVWLSQAQDWLEVT